MYVFVCVFTSITHLGSFPQSHLHTKSTESVKKKKKALLKKESFFLCVCVAGATFLFFNANRPQAWSEGADVETRHKANRSSVSLNIGEKQKSKIGNMRQTKKKKKKRSYVL